MSDLIRRENVVSRISDLLMIELQGKRLPTWNEVYNAINGIPSAEPERKKGKWEDRIVCYIAKCEYQTAKCSVCGKYLTTPYLYYFDEYKFCPSCGAEMTRGENGQA